MNGAQAIEAARARSFGLGSLVVLGAAITTIGLIADPAQGFGGLLVAAFVGLSLVVGSLIVISTAAVSSARWWLPVREIPVLVARTLPVPVVALAAVLAFGLRAIYPWARADVMGASHLLQGKALWLNPSFFVARAVLVVAIWFLFVAAFRDRVAGLVAGGPEASRRLARASALFLVALGPTISIAAWDWTMSLMPEWFSTMWAVYAFAGAFQGGIAAIVVVALALERRGVLARPLTDAVRHDLGKLLFAFSCFWAYIWFCQYMLIWYANLPEETTWFAARFGAGYTMLFWLDPILNWVAPFVVLMMASAKKNPAVLGQTAMLVLAGRWLDTYLMVQPSLGPSPGFPVYAIGAALAVGAGMLLLLGRLQARG